MARYRDGLAVAWYDTRDGNAEIYLRLADPDGRPVWPELRLTEDDEASYVVSVDAVGDALALAWYGRRSDDTLQAHLGVWDPEHGWRWRIELGDVQSSRNPVVRAHGETIFCAWVEPDGMSPGAGVIKYGFWGQDGAELTGPLVLAAAGDETWNLNAAFDADGESVFVAFDAPDSTGTYELFLGRADPDGATVTQLSASDGFASKYPDIAISTQDNEKLAAITWFDDKDGNQETYVAVAPVDALGGGAVDAMATRISHTAGASIGSYLAWHGDRVGVAWSDQLSESYDIQFQWFDSDAEPRSEIIALTQSRANAFVPAILSDGDGFAIAWNEIPDGNDDLHNSQGSEIWLSRVTSDR